MEKGIIQANELRIGNLVYDRGDKILRIDYWERKDMIAQKVVVGGFVGHPFTEDIEFLKPIPLTEEWLLKFGFEFGMKFQDFVKGKYKFTQLKNKILYGEFSEEGIFYFNTITKIKYLHQLQNLYFALTNEELTIKENGK